MATTLIKTAFVVGLLAVWLGFAIFSLVYDFRYVRSGKFRRGLTMRNAARLEMASRFTSEEFPRFWRSRAGRVSQVLLAFGSGVLILAGIGWVVLRIVEKQSGAG